MAVQFDNFSDLPPLAREHLTTLEIFVGDAESDTDLVAASAVTAINALANMIRLQCVGQACEHCEPGHGCGEKK